jgi:hypothetical protein
MTLLDESPTLVLFPVDVQYMAATVQKLLSIFDRPVIVQFNFGHRGRHRQLILLYLQQIEYRERTKAKRYRKLLLRYIKTVFIKINEYLECFVHD